jgi:hypothetical protein
LQDNHHLIHNPSIKGFQILNKGIHTTKGGLLLPLKNTNPLELNIDGYGNMQNIKHKLMTVPLIQNKFMNHVVWNLNDYFNYGPCRANPSLGDSIKNHLT